MELPPASVLTTELAPEGRLACHSESSKMGWHGTGGQESQPRALLTVM